MARILSMRLGRVAQIGDVRVLLRRRGDRRDVFELVIHAPGEVRTVVLPANSPLVESDHDGLLPDLPPTSPLPKDDIPF